MYWVINISLTFINIGGFITRINKWKVLKRTKILDTKYLKVYEDRVRLPNGTIIPDFTLVKKLDVVLVVATDMNNRVITIMEYKHGAGEVQMALPAGMLDRSNESLLKTAKRELKEETGFEGGTFTYLGFLYDYPSKDMHKVHIFRARNVVKKSKQGLETTETITEVKLLPVKKIRMQIKNGKCNSSSVIAALVLSGLLL